MNADARSHPIRARRVILLAQDPTAEDKRYRWRDYRRAFRQGRAPGWEIARAVPRYLRPSHHPSREGSLQPALDYLARSPAARTYAAEAS